MDRAVETDILGAPYECQVIELDDDAEGRVVATLVRCRPAQPTGRAVLYVHGYTDYFFQTHMAEFFTQRGWDFYALDLRKHGRSLLPHQTANFCLDLSEYFGELDEAVRIIREENGNHTLLVCAHSTGGLTTALWTHARRADRLVDGLFLNSPFFDANAPWLVRRVLMAAACRLARWMPYRALPRGLRAVYGQSLHVNHQGEWTYDLAWKPLGGFPVRLGWLAAVRRAQRQLRGGLAIPVPIMVACSARSYRGATWDKAAMLADTVLDVDHMVRWAPKLGRHVTLARFDGGLHDLTLSGPAVRSQVFAELDRWLTAFVVPRPTAGESDSNRGRAGGSPDAQPAPPRSSRSTATGRAEPLTVSFSGTDPATPKEPAPRRTKR